jgi:predicted O-methyltransferase YrrM
MTKSDEPRLSWDELAAAVREQACNGDRAESVVRLLADVARLQLARGAYPRYFRLWEERGFHLTPVHFYSPIPDLRTLPSAPLERESQLPGIELNVDFQLELVRKVFPRYRDEYMRIPIERTTADDSFYLANTMFGGVDALILYCMIRYLEPQLVLEIGSGMSSRLIAEAAVENQRPRLVSIDPYPDLTVRSGLPSPTSLITKRVEEVDLEVFQRLESNDILFIDSSHVVRYGGDVNYLFLEVIPRLSPGVVVHVHDVFIPHEYPEAWVKDKLRFWSEQYLLQAFLAFNTEFEVLLSTHYLRYHHWSDVVETFPSGLNGGGSFWMRRKQIGTP